MRKLSLFQIQYELENIIEQLESGEATDELLQALAISEQDLVDKLESYKQVIAAYDNDVNACKKEKDRVNQVQKVKTNAIERLKKLCLEAVLAYGKLGKSGNKVVDGATWKMFTKSSSSVDVKELLVADIIKHYINIVCEYLSSTDSVESLDTEYCAAIVEKYINAEIANSSSFTGEDRKSVTIAKEDIECTNVDITISLPLSKLGSIEHLELTRYIGQHPHLCDVKADINKTLLKEYMKTVSLNIADIKESVSLQIK